MNTPTRTLSLAGLMAVGATAASAAAIPSVVTTSPGIDVAANAVTSSASDGTTMDGMVVTVTFGNDTTSTGVWAATGAESGHAVGAGWSLSVEGPTHVNPWALRNNSGHGIVSFSIDAAPGKSGFDIDDSVFGTPGSEGGRPFGDLTITGRDVFAAHGTYSNRLLVGGTFYGDMYERLDVDLGGILLRNGLLEFYLDTDRVNFASTVPEPETYALMLAGLGVVTCVARRRRNGDSR